MDEAYVLSFIATTLNVEHLKLGSWEAVAKKYDRPKGTLHRIASEPGYCPAWLQKPIKQLVKNMNHKDLFEMTSKGLLWALENRVEMSSTS